MTKNKKQYQTQRTKSIVKKLKRIDRNIGKNGVPVLLNGKAVDFVKGYL